jgi:hypothetical protein
MPRVFNPRNDQVNSSSLLYRKRPTSESIEGLNETKQVKGIKWVAATTEEVQVRCFSGIFAFRRSLNQLKALSELLAKYRKFSKRHEPSIPDQNRTTLQ